MPSARKNAAQARRLLAIAAVLEGASRKEAAKIGGRDRQTLRDWVIRFNEQGADGLTYRWARKDSRPRAAHDQRTQATYLFGAVCPERGAGAASCCRPATPKLCSFTSMRSQPKSLRALTLFSSSIAHAILLLDQAGWLGAKALKVPNNISFARAPRFE